MKEQLEKIKLEALDRMEAADSLDTLNEIRVAYLGKKGELTSVLKSMKDVAPEDRPKVGQMVNEVRELLETKLEETKTALMKKARKEQMEKEVIDVTLPAKKIRMGHSHPNSIALSELERIFVGMGYEVVEGPEVEYDRYNFEKLNIPKGHPARDEQDTVYINDTILLRSQTSPVQVRVMETRKPPIRIIAPGRVFRSDAVDATHSPSFHQIEGLVIDKNITFADLKGTLEEFAKELEELLQKWKDVRQAEYQRAPALLWQESTFALKAVRDFYGADVDSFVVNDAQTYRQLKQTGDFDGQGQPKLVHYQEKTPLFATFFIESKWEKALAERVWLKSGGYLVIQETEACVVIDVNSAKAAGRGDLENMILKTNLEAAAEAAKQMRLRNLSGIIIIDFIDMVQEENKKRRPKALEEAVEQDRGMTVVVGMTTLGLMQVTRKKTRPSLSKQVTTKCRVCEGSGRMPSVDSVAARMRRETEQIFASTIYRKVLVYADARLLHAYLGRDDAFAKKMLHQYQAEVDTEEKKGEAFGWYDIISVTPKAKENT